MTDDLPPPLRRCPACDGGHYVAVRFCPFCGVPQERESVEAQPSPPVAPAEPAPDRPPVDLPQPQPVPPRRPAAPPRAPAAPPPPRPEVRWPVPRRPAPYRRRFGLRGVVLALVAIAGLTAFALARRDALPAPTRITVGPAWTVVALGPFQGAPLWRLSGDGPFTARLDGDRILRIAPGGGATMRVRTLRGLELRTGRGPVTVTLTPRRE